MTRPNQNTYPYDWPPQPFYSHNPTDYNIYLESVIPGPGDKPFLFYSSGWQKGVAQEAIRMGAIKLYDLIFILAKDYRYFDILPKLWDYSGLGEKANDRFPEWQSSMAESERDRAYIWYWVLCSWTIYDKYQGQYPAKSYFFGEIKADDHNDIGPVIWKRSIPLLTLYEYENGQFKEVNEAEEQSLNQYIRLDKFRDYLKTVGDEYELCIPLPRLLFTKKDESHEVLDVSSIEQNKSSRKHRPCQRHKIECREVAKNLWKKDSTLTIADMPMKDEITEACEGKIYAEKTIRNWIKELCPNRSPGRRPNK